MIVEYNTRANNQPRMAGTTVHTSEQRMKESTKANELESARITRYGRGSTTIAPSTTAGLTAQANKPSALMSIA